MAGSHRLMVVLHLLFLFLASVHATQWHVLWMANPDDSHAYEVPAHGPKTNSAIISMLNDDKAKVFWSRTRIIGTEGYTWYYLTDISTETYEKRYKDLPHISGHIVYDSETNAGAATMPAFNLDFAESTNASSSASYKRGVKRRATQDQQDDAPRHLAFISKPESQPQIPFEYNYESENGKGIRVYNVDSGLNLESSEWQGDRDISDPAWISTGPWAVPNSKKDTDVEDHGTCGADVAVGKVNGVAKKADITSVVVDEYSHELLFFFAEELWLDGLAKIVDDIATRGQGPKSVVLMPFSVPGSDNDLRGRSIANAFATILKTLDERGVTLVAAMPNDRKCYQEYPCSCGDPGSPDRHVANLITVRSAVLSTGEYPPFERDPNNIEPWLTTWAPGDDPGGYGLDSKEQVRCANPTGDMNRPPDDPYSGTSVATAMVAGLMAHFLSLGLSRDDAIARLRDYSYPHRNGGPDMIWNGWN